MTLRSDIRRLLVEFVTAYESDDVSDVDDLIESTVAEIAGTVGLYLQAQLED